MTRIYLFFLFLGLASATGLLHADTEGTRVQHYNLKKGIALQGYDPVIYFTQGTAKKGSAQNSYTYQGVTYHFVSPSNLTTFKNNPSQYEPQYGGWCAYAFAKGGGKVKIDPKHFKIINQKLYLFFDTPIWGNTLKKWNKGSDQAQISKANAEWAKIIN